MLVTQCPCGARYHVADESIGRKVRCRQCGEAFVVARADAAASSSPPASRTDAPAPPDIVKVPCTCGKNLKLPKSAIGRQIRCPACRQVFTAALPRPATVAANPPSDADTGGSLLDDLARQESSAESQSVPDLARDHRECPHCRHPMAADASVCPACGYGAPKQASDRSASARPSRLVGMLGSAGRFLVGCALSGVGALIGAGIWFLIAKSTGYEIGYLAWALGGMAGVGMLLGYGRQDVRAGLAAAGISTAGIVFAKAMVFAFVIYAFVTGNTSNIDLQREFVKARMTDEMLGRSESDSDKDDDAKWDAAYAEVGKRVDKMTKEQVRAKWDEFKKADEASTLEADQRRLASHRAGLKADALGLARFDDQRFRLLDEEFNKCKQIPADTLKADLAALDRWEAGEKWSDAQYVRNYLVYAYADEAAKAENAGKTGLGDSQQKDPTASWKTHYAAAVTRVDAMSPDDRLARAKQHDTERRQRIEKMVAQFKEKAAEADAEPEEGGIAAGGLIAFFFKAMFGGKDIIFLLLAIVTAYKIAAGGSQS